MKSDNQKVYALVDPDNKDYSFIKGNTKYLRDMNQDELAILFKNGDDRVKEENGDTVETAVKVTKTPKPKPAPALEIPAENDSQAEGQA